MAHCVTVAIQALCSFQSSPSECPAAKVEQKGSEGKGRELWEVSDDGRWASTRIWGACGEHLGQVSVMEQISRGGSFSVDLWMGQVLPSSLQCPNC